MATENPTSRVGPSRSSASGPSSYVDPAALMRIKNLPLRAKRIAEGFFNGLHRSPFHGFSVEFSEYRPYTTGDDLRHLDWKLFARTDRYYIKQFEDETNRRCYLLLDQSKSMSYGSIEYAKSEYARTLAATLGYYLTLQKDSVGLLTFDETVADFLPARHRPGQLHQMMVCLERAPAGTATDLTSPLEQITSMIRKRGLVILISDLLAPIGTLQKNLGYLRTRGHDVMLMRVLDPAEVSFPFGDAAMIHDLESGRDIFVDPTVARDDYLRQFREHREQLRSICGATGVEYVQLLTSEPLENALFNLMRMQMSRGRSVMRSSASRGARR